MARRPGTSIRRRRLSLEQIVVMARRERSSRAELGDGALSARAFASARGAPCSTGPVRVPRSQRCACF